MAHIRHAMVLLGVLWTLPSAVSDELVAFSLGAARERVQAGGMDWRMHLPEVFTLGGITRFRGLVFDPASNDIILVGERNQQSPLLSLDDLAVALRARFVYQQWPLVSIDPSTISGETGIQRVRYEGGIGMTQFGRDMFEADLKLKRIALGVDDSGAQGITSLVNLWLARLYRGDKIPAAGSTVRFWFYPLNPAVTVRENVAAIDSVRVGVFSELLPSDVVAEAFSNTQTDASAEEFAAQLTANYAEIGATHRSIARLAGLDELVALSIAVDQLGLCPNVEYWCGSYLIRPVPTPPTQNELTRDLRWRDRMTRISGGVQLTALSLRLQAGDVSALRDAALAARPSMDTCSWAFDSTWGVPCGPKDEATLLATQAAFLQQQGADRDAETLYSRALLLEPNNPTLFSLRGLLYLRQEDFQRALADFNQALVLGPLSVEARNNRGIALARLGRNAEARHDLEAVLDQDPLCSVAFFNLGILADRQDQPSRALDMFDRAIARNPEFAAAYLERGRILTEGLQLQGAIAEFTHAIEADPACASAYLRRGGAHAARGEKEQARQDCQRALELSRFGEVADEARSILLGL